MACIGGYDAGGESTSDPAGRSPESKSSTWGVNWGEESQANRSRIEVLAVA